MDEPEIVTPGDVALSPKLSVVAIVQPLPEDPGTVKVADQDPADAENDPTVDEPEQPPPQVALESEDGAVPV